jgi:hypothetical protein
MLLRSGLKIIQILLRTSEIVPGGISFKILLIGAFRTIWVHVKNSSFENLQSLNLHGASSGDDDKVP